MMVCHLCADFVPKFYLYGILLESLAVFCILMHYILSIYSLFSLLKQKS